MIFKDNREFISALEKTGDIVKIKEEKKAYHVDGKAEV